MADAHKNFAYSLIATAPSPATSGTSLVVTAGQGALFPAVPFNATIWPASTQPLSTNAEIVRVTARSTDTLTITRAQEGTAARTVVIGDQIAATVTAKTLTDVETDSVYGDGSDGSVTFDGSTTILGMAPASSIYTLTRDFFFTDVTLNNNVQIKTNGYRMFVNGTLTGGGAAAIIQWNGNAAAATVAGANLNNNLSSFNIQTGATSPGVVGGAASTVAGNAGTAQTGRTYGGAGGAGGSGSGGTNAGGAGGTIVAPTATQGTLRQLPQALLLLLFTAATNVFVVVQGGAGGGSGGGDGTNSGAGGGGGGIVGVYAKTFAGTGAIQARGGAGGVPAGGNRGGGGGAGGGLVVVVSGSVSAGAISGWTIDANGGTGGAKTGTGVAGSNGSNGTVILIQN